MKVSSESQPQSMLEKFQEIVQATSDLVGMADSNGRTLFLNKSGRRMLGIGEDEDLSDVRISEYHTKDVADIVSNVAIPAAIRDGLWSGETSLLRRDGCAIPVHQVVIAHRGPDGDFEYVSTIARDLSEMKESDRARREGEQQYKRIVETTLEGVWLIDAETRTTFVNDRMAEMLGYSTDEMLGRPLFDFMDERAQVEAKRNMQRRRKGIREQHDFRFRRKDGQDLWTTINTNPLTDDDGQFVGALAMVSDITERKQIEQTLRENERRLKNLFENSPDAVFLQDLNGNVLDVNQAACKLHRMNRDGLIGKNVRDLVPPERREEVARDYPTLAEGDHSLIEGMSYTADGERIPVEIRASRLNHDEPVPLLHVREITDRIKAERDLSISERRFRTIVDQAAVGVALMETATGKFELINKKFCDMIGYSRDEITNQTFMAITHPDDLQEDLDNMDRLIAGEIREFSMEKRYFHRDGSIVWANLTVSPTWEPSEQPDHHIAIVVDITDRKRIEEAMRKSEERLSLAVRATNDAIWDWDVLNNNVWWNQVYDDTFGVRPPEQTTWEWWRDRIHPEDREQVTQSIRAALDGDRERWIAEYRYKRMDGTYLDVIDRAYIARDESGKPTRVLGAMLDITDRKQTENRLRLTQFALDRSVDGAFWCRPDASFSYVNDATCCMFGYSRKDLMRLSVIDLDMNASADKWPQHWDGIKDAGSIILETRGCRRDGSVFPVELTLYYVEFDGQEMCCAFVRDITERKHAEGIFKATRFAVEAVGESMFRVAEDGSILDVNESACNRLGYSREELLRLSVSDVNPECTTEVWSQRWNAAKERGQMLFETVHRSKNGEVFPVEISSTYVDFDGQEFSFAFVRDISTRKKAEKNLKSQTHQLAAVHEAMSVFLESGNWHRASQRILRAALTETESEYGFIGMLKDGTLRVYSHEGIQWHDTKGRELYKSALEDYKERGYLLFDSFENLFGHAITHKEVVISNNPPVDERSHGTPVGHPPLNHFLGVPIFRGPEVVGMIGVANRAGGYSATDTPKIEILCGAIGVLYESHRQREREELLEQQRRQMEYSAEIRQKMADTVADERRKIGGELHDSLGQNLTGLAFMCERLQRKLQQQASDEAPYAQEMAKLTTTALMQVRRMVRGLYPIELIEQPLVTCLEELAAQTQNRFGVTCRFIPHTTIASLDSVVATQVYYIAQEVVNNAIKHSKADRIDILIAQKKTLLVLSVSDNGTGFDPESIDEEGMGLGVMKSRATSIEAELTIESNPGTGTKITCTLEPHGETT